MHRQPDQAEHEWTPLAAAAGADQSEIPASIPVSIPVSILDADQERVAPDPLAPEPDSRDAGLRERLEEVRRRAQGAASWLETSHDYARLLNSAGVVPVTARFDARDLAFLGQAREDLLAFAELGLRLADLHRPLDAGGTTSDPANPALRCRSCMWRWPCPTLRLMTEVLAGGEPPAPSAPGHAPSGWLG